MATKINNKASNVQYETYDYVSLLNLADKSRQPQLLTGFKPPKRHIKEKQMENNFLIQQPELLKSAKNHLQKHRQKQQFQSESSYDNQGASMISRQNTPLNPIGSKKGKSNKQKLTSMGSQLFQITSNPQQRSNNKNIFNSLIINQCSLGQDQVVYRYVFNKSRTLPQKTLQHWRECLSHEDMVQIYKPIGQQQPNIPYSHARKYPLNQIQRGLRKVLGNGKQRALAIGEQASIIQGIQKYLQNALKQPLKIGRKDFDIIEDILKNCKLQNLQHFPQAMKQVETHFKLMVTQWRYSGKINTGDKTMQSALIMGKNNFLDLNKKNILVQFLLAHSNIKQLIK